MDKDTVAQYSRILVYGDKTTMMAKEWEMWWAHRMDPRLVFWGRFIRFSGTWAGTPPFFELGWEI
jgi:hypothetical protein